MEEGREGVILGWLSPFIYTLGLCSGGGGKPSETKSAMSCGAVNNQGKRRIISTCVVKQHSCSLCWISSAAAALVRFASRFGSFYS